MAVAIRKLWDRFTGNTDSQITLNIEMNKEAQERLNEVHEKLKEDKMIHELPKEPKKEQIHYFTPVKEPIDFERLKEVFSEFTSHNTDNQYCDIVIRDPGYTSIPTIEIYCRVNDLKDKEYVEKVKDFIITESSKHLHKDVESMELKITDQHGFGNTLEYEYKRANMIGY